MEPVVRGIVRKDEQRVLLDADQNPGRHHDPPREVRPRESDGEGEQAQRLRHREHAAARVHARQFPQYLGRQQLAQARRRRAAQIVTELLAVAGHVGHVGLPTMAFMIALIQRVSQAHVRVESQVVGEIGRGVLAFICAVRGDTEEQADALLAKVLSYRIFPDDAGKMNRSLRDVGGGLLIVSQFTLAADTHSGTRPSLTPAAAPDEGRRLYDHFVSRARLEHRQVAAGIFGAMMQIELINDGPVTFWLQVRPGQ